MTRDEFAWLIVRAVGAFLLLLIALDLITLALTFIQAVIVYNGAMTNIANPDDDVQAAILYGRAIERIWYLGITIGLKAAFSYYCFYHGAWIHRLLTSRLPPVEQS